MKNIYNKRENAQKRRNMYQYLFHVCVDVVMKSKVKYL